MAEAEGVEFEILHSGFVVDLEEAWYHSFGSQFCGCKFARSGQAQDYNAWVGTCIGKDFQPELGGEVWETCE